MLTTLDCTVMMWVHGIIRDLKIVLGCIQRMNATKIHVYTHGRGSNKFTNNANNGCLGDFDRGKTQTAAILVGEVPSTFDPAVSEWGNLTSFTG